MCPAIVGGIGMFLLGMSLLTDGLQTAAVDALRTLLRRYTRTRLSALATGAFVTALVQSSSAVTVATIGFVGVGLLTFTGAFGVICGANVGTTATAWIVAGLGLKVTMSVVALPLIGVGASASCSCEVGAPRWGSASRASGSSSWASTHCNGPQAFHDMIAALCEAKAIVTAEHDHVVYALNARKESCWNDSDEAEAPGYNTKPVHKILELSRNGRNDFASLTARYIQNNINSDDEELAQSAQIPEAVMHALSPQNYSWREIGHLVNRFNEEGIVPLFSLKTLQAAVDQDLGPENIKQRPAHYHLH